MNLSDRDSVWDFGGLNLGRFVASTFVETSHTDDDDILSGRSLDLSPSQAEFETDNSRDDSSKEYLDESLSSSEDFLDDDKQEEPLSVRYPYGNNGGILIPFRRLETIESVEEPIETTDQSFTTDEEETKLQEFYERKDKYPKSDTSDSDNFNELSNDHVSDDDHTSEITSATFLSGLLRDTLEPPQFLPDKERSFEDTLKSTPEYHQKVAGDNAEGTSSTLHDSAEDIIEAGQHDILSDPDQILLDASITSSNSITEDSPSDADISSLPYDTIPVISSSDDAVSNIETDKSEFTTDQSRYVINITDSDLHKFQTQDSSLSTKDAQIVQPQNKADTDRDRSNISELPNAGFVNIKDKDTSPIPRKYSPEHTDHNSKGDLSNSVHDNTNSEKKPSDILNKSSGIATGTTALKDSYQDSDPPAIPYETFPKQIDLTGSLKSTEEVDTPGSLLGQAYIEPAANVKLHTFDKAKSGVSTTVSQPAIDKPKATHIATDVEDRQKYSSPPKDDSQQGIKDIPTIRHTSLNMRESDNRTSFLDQLSNALHVKTDKPQDTPNTRTRIDNLRNHKKEAAESVHKETKIKYKPRTSSSTSDESSSSSKADENANQVEMEKFLGISDVKIILPKTADNYDSINKNKERQGFFGSRYMYLRKEMDEAVLTDPSDSKFTLPDKRDSEIDMTMEPSASGLSLKATTGEQKAENNEVLFDIALVGQEKDHLELDVEEKLNEVDVQRENQKENVTLTFSRQSDNKEHIELKRQPSSQGPDNSSNEPIRTQNSVTPTVMTRKAERHSMMQQSKTGSYVPDYVRVATIKEPSTSRLSKRGSFQQDGVVRSRLSSSELDASDVSTSTSNIKIQTKTRDTENYISNISNTRTAVNDKGKPRASVRSLASFFEKVWTEDDDATKQLKPNDRNTKSGTLPRTQNEANVEQKIISSKVSLEKSIGAKETRPIIYHESVSLYREKQKLHGEDSEQHDPKEEPVSNRVSIDASISIENDDASKRYQNDSSVLQTKDVNIKPVIPPRSPFIIPASPNYALRPFQYVDPDELNQSKLPPKILEKSAQTRAIVAKYKALHNSNHEENSALQQSASNITSQEGHSLPGTPVSSTAKLEPVITKNVYHPDVSYPKTNVEKRDSEPLETSLTSLKMAIDSFIRGKLANTSSDDDEKSDVNNIQQKDESVPEEIIESSAREDYDSEENMNHHDRLESKLSSFDSETQRKATSKIHNEEPINSSFSESTFDSDEATEKHKMKLKYNVNNQSTESNQEHSSSDIGGSRQQPTKGKSSTKNRKKPKARHTSKKTKETSASSDTTDSETNLDYETAENKGKSYKKKFSKRDKRTTVTVTDDRNTSASSTDDHVREELVLHKLKKENAKIKKKKPSAEHLKRDSDLDTLDSIKATKKGKKKTVTSRDLKTGSDNADSVTNPKKKVKKKKTKPQPLRTESDLERSDLKEMEESSSKKKKQKQKECNKNESLSDIETKSEKVTKNKARKDSQNESDSDSSDNNKEDKKNVQIAHKKKTKGKAKGMSRMLEINGNVSFTDEEKSILVKKKKKAKAKPQNTVSDIEVEDENRTIKPKKKKASKLTKPAGPNTNEDYEDISVKKDTLLVRSERKSMKKHREEEFSDYSGAKMFEKKKKRKSKKAKAPETSSDSDDSDVTVDKLTLPEKTKLKSKVSELDSEYYIDDSHSMTLDSSFNDPHVHNLPKAKHHKRSSESSSSSSSSSEGDVINNEAPAKPHNEMSQISIQDFDTPATSRMTGGPQGFAKLKARKSHRKSSFKKALISRPIPMDDIQQPAGPVQVWGQTLPDKKVKRVIKGKANKRAGSTTRRSIVGMPKVEQREENYRNPIQNIPAQPSYNVGVHDSVNVTKHTGNFPRIKKIKIKKKPKNVDIQGTMPTHNPNTHSLQVMQEMKPRKVRKVKKIKIKRGLSPLDIEHPLSRSSPLDMNPIPNMNTDMGQSFPVVQYEREPGSNLRKSGRRIKQIGRKKSIKAESIPDANIPNIPDSDEDFYGKQTGSRTTRVGPLSRSSSTRRSRIVRNRQSSSVNDHEGGDGNVSGRGLRKKVRKSKRHPESPPQAARLSIALQHGGHSSESEDFIRRKSSDNVVPSGIGYTKKASHKSVSSSDQSYSSQSLDVGDDHSQIEEKENRRLALKGHYLASSMDPMYERSSPNYELSDQSTESDSTSAYDSYVHTSGYGRQQDSRQLSPVSDGRHKGSGPVYGVMRTVNRRHDGRTTPVYDTPVIKSRRGVQSPNPNQPLRGTYI